MNSIFRKLTGGTLAPTKSRIWFYQYPNQEPQRLIKNHLGWSDGNGIYHSALSDAKKNIKYYGGKFWSKLI